MKNLPTPKAVDARVRDPRAALTDEQLRFAEAVGNALAAAWRRQCQHHDAEPDDRPPDDEPSSRG